MSDEVLRELERAARDGDFAARERLWLEQARRGDVSGPRRVLELLLKYTPAGSSFAGGEVTFPVLVDLLRLALDPNLDPLQATPTWPWTTSLAGVSAWCKSGLHVTANERPAARGVVLVAVHSEGGSIVTVGSGRTRTLWTHVSPGTAWPNELMPWKPSYNGRTLGRLSSWRQKLDAWCDLEKHDRIRLPRLVAEALASERSREDERREASKCQRCGGTGLVAATPGRPEDGTVPCLCARPCLYCKVALERCGAVTRTPEGFTGSRCCPACAHQLGPALVQAAEALERTIPSSAPGGRHEQEGTAP